MAQTIYPDAPRVGVGAVVVHQNRVLLVLRGKPPGEGFWAIPGGSVELGETLQQTAEREILEETGLRIRAGEVVYTFDAIQRDETGRVQYHYVIIDLLASVVDDPPPPLQPADDVEDARWFSWAEIEQTRWPIMPTTKTLLKNLRL